MGDASRAWFSGTGSRTYAVFSRCFCLSSALGEDSLDLLPAERIQLSVQVAVMVTRYGVDRRSGWLVGLCNRPSSQSGVTELQRGAVWVAGFRGSWRGVTNVNRSEQKEKESKLTVAQHLAETGGICRWEHVVVIKAGVEWRW